MLKPRRPSRRAVAGFAVVALIALAFGTLRLLPLFSRDEPAEGVPLAVFAEFGELADRVYSAPADDPTKRTLLATLEHAPGWGLNPAAVTRDSRAVFLLAPSEGGGRDTPAEVWTIDLKTGQRSRLASDADLLIQPVLNRDGSILYRRSTGQKQEIVRLDPGTGTRRATYSEETAFGIFPVGEDADGDLIIARLSTKGTDLARVREGSVQVIVHASDHLARGWQIAPDGKSLAYLAPEVRGERVVYRTHVVSLPDGKPRSVAETPEAADHFNPAWTPDGGLTVGQDARTGAGAITLIDDARPRTLRAPDRGFDVPLSWSGGGTYLAIRSFDGDTASNPGNERTVLLGPDGERYPIAAPGDVIFIGWITRA
ncbi:MAG: hypothetical protein EPO65_08905 [Dehalococcoidia bacterium]|nr:MAG: hypothetical protein EPO65_08905 [Dehalococcoidia bacterium]